MIFRGQRRLKRAHRGLVRPIRDGEEGEERA